LKSYGEDWKDSLIKISLHRRGSQEVETVEISGEHKKKTSETYRYKLHLQTPIDFDDIITVEFDLVSGTNFKLIGMTLCSF